MNRQFILSTEKAQDGNIVYTNIKMVLEDTAEALRNSDEIMRMDNLKTLTEILEDTDGCSVQYRCGTALYLLHKLAHENNIIYDRSINTPGHGKIIIASSMIVVSIHLVTVRLSLMASMVLTRVILRRSFMVMLNTSQKPWPKEIGLS